MVVVDVVMMVVVVVVMLLDVVVMVVVMVVMVVLVLMRWLTWWVFCFDGVYGGFPVTFAGVHLGEQQEGVGPGRLWNLRMETHCVVVRGLQEEEKEEQEEEGRRKRRRRWRRRGGGRGQDRGGGGGVFSHTYKMLIGSWKFMPSWVPLKQPTPDPESHTAKKGVWKQDKNTKSEGKGTQNKTRFLKKDKVVLDLRL